jgi:TonB family protein
LVHAVPAVYPTDPGLTELKRVCILDVIVGADGIPTRVQALGTHCSPFDGSAITAVRQSKFEPGKVDGNPVPVRMQVCVPFLDGKTPAIPEKLPSKGTAYPPTLNHVEPEYTKEARRAKLEGAVIVSVLVTEDGMPTDAFVTSPLGKGLDEKAMEAVGKYQFRPATMYGVPVPLRITVLVNFRLPPR